MKRKTLALMMCFLAALAGCLPGANAFAENTAAGQEDAERLIVLAAADCEILYALGAGDKLVGRGEYCNWPAEIEEIAIVKSGAETNLEEILALSPDAIIMPVMAQTIEQEEALRQAGINVIITDAQDIAGVYEAIGIIGAAVGKEQEARDLTEEMKKGFGEIASRSKKAGKTVYFEVSPLEWGLWAAGKGTFMDEIAEICGLENIFSDVEGWGSVSEEQIFALDPDYIVTTAMDLGFGPSPVEEIMGRRGWDSLRAVKNAGIFQADSDAITRPGPRLLEAAQALYAFISEE